VQHRSSPISSYCTTKSQASAWAVRSRKMRRVLYEGTLWAIIWQSQPCTVPRLYPIHRSNTRRICSASAI
jgi:hypothetical protein